MSEHVYAWLDSLAEVEQIAAHKQYIIEEGAPILSVGLNELLDSTGVQKALRVNFPNMECYSFGELWDMEYMDIVRMLRKVSLGLTVDEVKSYDKELSQIVYDANNIIRAAILVNKAEDGYFVDLLIGTSRQSQYIMTAAQRFIIAVKTMAVNDYGRISTFAANQVVKPLLERVLDKGVEIKEEGRIHYVRLESPDEELTEAIERACEAFPNQKNIAWKTPWSLKATLHEH